MIILSRADLDLGHFEDDDDTHCRAQGPESLGCVVAVGFVSTGVHINTRNQGFPAGYCTSILSTVSGLNVVADHCCSLGNCAQCTLV